MRRWWSRMTIVGAALAIAVVGYAVARESRGSSALPGRARAAPVAAASPTPAIGQLPVNPDTTKAWWHVPYLQADQAKERRDQVVNGITVGPTAAQRSPQCAVDSVESATLDDAAGTPLAIAPKYVPVWTERGPSHAATCQIAGARVIASSDQLFMVDPNTARGSRGGRFSIVRFRGDPSVALGIPAERWEPRTVAGRPAAVANPILANGLGESAVVVDADGIVTKVQAFNLPLDEVLRIAEGLY